MATIKSSRFSERQIGRNLQEAASGKTTQAELCRELGVSPKTLGVSADLLKATPSLHDPDTHRATASSRKFLRNPSRLAYHLLHRSMRRLCQPKVRRTALERGLQPALGSRTSVRRTREVPAAVRGTYTYDGDGIRRTAQEGNVAPTTKVWDGSDDLLLNEVGIDPAMEIRHNEAGIRLVPCKRECKLLCKANERNFAWVRPPHTWPKKRLKDVLELTLIRNWS